MEFGLSRTIQLASSSLAGCRPAANRSAASWSQTWLPICRSQVRAILTCRDSSKLVADRFAAGLRPASELDSVIEFGLSRTIQLASRSHTCSRAGRRPGFRSVAVRFELYRHVEIARSWPQTGSQLVCNLLASC